jgi:hypothetical protein
VKDLQGHNKSQGDGLLHWAFEVLDSALSAFLSLIILNSCSHHPGTSSHSRLLEWELWCC